MKLNQKSNIIILIILGILFTLSSIFITNLNFKNSEFSDGINLDKENLEISKVSGKIHIDDANPSMNWSVAKKDGICTGNGTYSEPYVIEDLMIDGGGLGSCILIENSTAYFRIELCNLYNSGDYPTAGIMLNNTSNGHLIDNICSPNFSGISLYNSHNNTVIGNTANNYNTGYGILLWNCDNNTISGNTANHNSAGISLHLGGAANNIITGNILRSNYYGIQVWSAVRNNNISNNIISKNSVCGIEIKGTNSDNLMYLNCFTDNGLNAYDSGSNNRWDNGTMGNYWNNYTGSDSDDNGIGDVPYNISGAAGNQDNFPLMKCPISTSQDGEGIPGYNLFILLGILSILTIYISKRVQKS